MSEVDTRLQEPADQMACGLLCQGRRDCGTGGEHHGSCRQSTLSDINNGTGLDKEYKIMSVKIKVELLLIRHNAQSPCNKPQTAHDDAPYQHVTEPTSCYDIKRPHQPVYNPQISAIFLR